MKISSFSYGEIVLFFRKWAIKCNELWRAITLITLSAWRICLQGCSAAFTYFKSITNKGRRGGGGMWILVLKPRKKYAEFSNKVLWNFLWYLVMNRLCLQNHHMNYFWPWFIAFHHLMNFEFSPISILSGKLSCSAEMSKIWNNSLGVFPTGLASR